MTTRFLDFMKEVFSQPDQCDPDKLKELLDETMGFFEEVQKKCSSPEAKEREEAMESLLGFKLALEYQMAQLSQTTGMAPEELALLAEEEEGFALEEKGELDEVKMKIAELKAQFPVEAKKKGPRKKGIKIRLTG